jgi:hypothetical protein
MLELACETRAACAGSNCVPNEDELCKTEGAASSNKRRSYLLVHDRWIHRMVGGIRLDERVVSERCAHNVAAVENNTALVSLRIA